MFEREDWTLFRNLETLGQKAGVPLMKLAALVVKELADNALDACGDCRVFEQDGWYMIEDTGPGIDGGAESIARLFSIRRPLTSSKLVRLPSRGALGNGLRVVAGAILASHGSLYVETHGERHTLTPCDDGSTEATSEPCARTEGTLVAVKFGPSIPTRFDPLAWAKYAIFIAGLGNSYQGGTSPWWYDRNAFYEMCNAAGDRSLVDLLVLFRNITHNIASSVIQESFGQKSISCAKITRDHADLLLHVLRNLSPAPKPSLLGKMGKWGGEYGYAIENGMIEVGHHTPAQVPYVIEVVVGKDDGKDKDSITVLVNHTPITGEVSISRHTSAKVGIFGCGLAHAFEVGRKTVSIVINVITPYMPITTDGKEPDLRRFLDPLHKVIGSAAKKAKRMNASGDPLPKQKGIIERVLWDAIEKASGWGQYRYSLRQLFYAVRPAVIDEFGKEPDYTYFATVITNYEAEYGDLPGLYRDPRGTLYHPHTGEEIPLGTINVERYSRPAWTFNKILYSEKEGFFPILRDAGWPERHDCALMTSKGFASRAARDLLDLLGDDESQGPIWFFCIHDADASGTMIFQALTEATKARRARKVNVINLGLDPDEALAMGLQVEEYRSEDDIKRRYPVAKYLEWEWSDWLQTKRVELNAMTTPQFLDWLDDKMVEYTEKVIPPSPVMRDFLTERTEAAVREQIAARLLAEAGIDSLVANAMADVHPDIDALDLTKIVGHSLGTKRQQRWDAPVNNIATNLAKKALNS